MQGRVKARHCEAGATQSVSLGSFASETPSRLKQEFSLSKRVALVANSVSQRERLHDCFGATRKRCARNDGCSHEPISSHLF
jgi:hypothetical protein